MSKKLRKYLVEHYAYSGFRSMSKIKKDLSIQIDDQDDIDNIMEFCNIFVTVGKDSCMEIDLSGGLPVTREIADFAEIYNGTVEPSRNRVVLRIKPAQIEALMELAARIRSTAELGYTINNPNWDKLAARTISSIYRFVRVIKEYRDLKNAGLL